MKSRFGESLWGYSGIYPMIISIIIFLAGATFGAPATLAESQTYEPAKEPESISTYVERYFADAPILADIAWCESRFRHVGDNGTVLRGLVDRDDIGIMQINTRYHLEDAEELGLDLFSLHGNLEYARYLYEKQGTEPWKASQTCWDTLAKK